MLKNKNILVTGGAGFIGCNLVRALVKFNNVTVIDNLSTGRIENLADIAADIKFIEGSITDLELLKKVAKEKDIVFHVAALPSVARSMADPTSTNLVNATGTLNILVAARDADVEKVVYSSSSSVYGDTPKLPKVETMTPNPISPYAVSKLTGEYYCTVFSKAFDLYTTSLRYFNVFGPYQDPNSMYAAIIPKFISASLKGKPMIVFGDGKQTRDFTFVRNAVDANIKAAESNKAGGMVLNIATHNRISINQLARIIIRLTGRKAPMVHKEPRPGDIKHSLANISLARKLIGYSPAIGLEEGLKETVEHLTKQFEHNII